ncbi:mannobiose 2-epimerase [Chitinophaga sp. CF118]|uniref:AGE family epimerase/isomerase n=1 Tax=Chitinophaga sp. CF118 TaxID=1884367 RepID=UPI0008E37547|nr:AGE family epimerase/isomerase [Chitinophaga sp. CF118]SFE97413.1 mannobiose 2-epimerase [Chitinophaga sp. CF118]
MQPLKQSAQTALKNILDFWMNHTPDHENGGFYGKLDNDNQVDITADKGAVLNTRILWTFSAAYNITKDSRYLEIAHRAFSYIDQHFLDTIYGGIFWSVDYKGNPAETKKQIYAQAFYIYACSEYYIATQNKYVKQLAIDAYLLIQQYSFDKSLGGYLEALTREWQEINDLRLSEKDANEKKTMNTHLHILEAYTNLYRIWPDADLAAAIRGLLDIFHDKILNTHTGHLNLFFDEHWQVKGDIISYGHDIEASWLLLEAAEVLNDHTLVEKFKRVAVLMADATLEGIDIDGGLWYEYEPSGHGLVSEKHWWPQAEALVGFVNAWQVNGDEHFLQIASNNWHFIEKYILDPSKGEWFWGRKKDYTIMPEDKAGFWKCPYHNGRACIELIKRL